MFFFVTGGAWGIFPFCLLCILYNTYYIAGVCVGRWGFLSVVISAPVHWFFFPQSTENVSKLIPCRLYFYRVCTSQTKTEDQDDSLHHNIYFHHIREPVYSHISFCLIFHWPWLQNVSQWKGDETVKMLFIIVIWRLKVSCLCWWATILHYWCAGGLFVLNMCFLCLLNSICSFNCDQRSCKVTTPKRWCNIM